MALVYFVPGLRIILGLLFIGSSVLKLPDLNGFSAAVASFNLFPRWAVKPIAYTIPFVEFIVGWWVLSGKSLLYAAYTGLVIMLVTTLVIFIALLLKRKVKNCGCYGTVIVVPLTWNKFVENIIWTILFVLLIFGTKDLMLLGII
ncbi:hypothetical protein COV18_06275 [Candidatus Woesearchaeota archaeon CG10_big_fil_rev_8_21_14_0_10_37_12]|nr:MAG: hypothetical protein COV18_06275 [Candidatus Woesearchaeota archaeon CG10_big_fil_rev_8_21_14_0_10_37_12]